MQGLESTNPVVGVGRILIKHHTDSGCVSPFSRRTKTLNNCTDKMKKKFIILCKMIDVYYGREGSDIQYLVLVLPKTKKTK